jgi:tRNA(Ile)-lysidine synthase
MVRNLLQRLRAHVLDQKLFPEPGRALLAVSGGPDSVAMLDLFTSLGPEVGLDLVVAHVDHGIVPESGGVAEQVAGLASRYQLPMYRATLAMGPDVSETRARHARYAALRRIRYLVTAHHADDQVETVVFRFLRGSGTAGLAGIPAEGAGGVVRPLLPFTRAELEGWLAARTAAGDEPLSVYRDPANVRDRHDRSWIRHRLLPHLRQRFGHRVETRVLDVARHAAGERRAWSALLRTLPELEFRSEDGTAEVARAPLQKYDKLLSEALLRALAREAGCIVGPRRAVGLQQFAVSAPSGRRLQLGGGWEAELSFDRLRIVAADRAVWDPAEEVVWGHGRVGRVRWGGWDIGWQEGEAADATRASYATWVTVGPGAIRGPTVGDVLVPLGGVGRRKVRRLMMEARIPWRERDSYPLVVRGGSILWIPGVCRARAALPRHGARALRLEAHAVGDH